MGCIFSESCNHRSGWCNATNAINKCLVGLNRLAGENTAELAAMQNKISELEKETEILRNENAELKSKSPAAKKKAVK